MSLDRLRRWWPVVAVAVGGAALLAVAVRTEHDDYRWAHDGVRATATVSQAETTGRRHAYLLTWTAGSQAYSAWTSDVLGRPAVGETIDVVVDPARPQAVRDGRGLRPYWWLGGLAPLTVAALALTAAWLLRPKRPVPEDDQVTLSDYRRLFRRRVPAQPK